MKKYKVSIGIPAFNEEVNIENLLRSLMSQKRRNFSLSQIVVYSDGSTDSTVNIVDKMQKRFSQIKIIKFKNRRGKIFRLNQIFRQLKGDVVIVLDADIHLVGNNFLNSFVSSIINNPRAKMVAAHQIPIRPKNLTGKIIHASFVTWDHIRLGIKDYDHVHNFYGAATAYRGSFVKSLHIPEGIYDERLYLYLMAKKTNGFFYCYHAKILYWPPITLHDFNKLSARSFGKKYSQLDKIFGGQVSDAYRIPTSYKIKGVIKALYHQPLYTPPALVLNLFLGKLRSGKQVSDSPIWEIIESSKKIYEKYV